VSTKLVLTLVPIDDAPTMAAAAKSLITNRDHWARMGAAARERASSMFGVHMMVHGIEKVFLENLAKQNG
jgi:glycosyltransferase involved in cell wall biosynthesis